MKEGQRNQGFTEVSASRYSVEQVRNYINASNLQLPEGGKLSFGHWGDKFNIEISIYLQMPRSVALPWIDKAVKQLDYQVKNLSWFLLSFLEAFSSVKQV